MSPDDEMRRLPILAPADSMPDRPIEYFDAVAPAYARQAANDPSFVERSELYERLIARYGGNGQRAGARALDLGCGTGVIARHLAGQGFATIGIDGSAGMIAAGEKLQRDATKGLEFRQAELPLDESIVRELEGSVQLLVCSSVIEYIEEDQRFLAHCERLLAPGGVALISFPNRASLYRRLEVRLRRTAVLRHSCMRVQAHQYTAEEVRAKTDAVGLETLESVFFTLPIHRYIHKLVRGRPRWLATLFVAVLRKPAGSGPA
ncbi:MAG: hypothetical protein NVSMB51_16070 [Solirubrobacteraceae bacterium]